MKRDWGMASDAMRDRVVDLLRREKAGALSADGVAELDRYLVLEHRMRIAKAKGDKGGTAW